LAVAYFLGLVAAPSLPLPASVAIVILGARKTVEHLSDRVLLLWNYTSGIA